MASAHLQQRALPHTWLPFSIFRLLTRTYICVWIYVFLMRVEKTYAQTMRSGDGALVKSLHPVVSPQASKLFSVTQILIWKSQLTELTEDRRKKKRKRGQPRSTVLLPLSFFFEPPPLFDWWLLIAGSCSSLFHVYCTQDALNDEERLPGQWVSLLAGRKTLCALDCETQCFTKVWHRIKITKIPVHVLIQLGKSECRLWNVV